jgi:cysteine desulfurase
MLIYLDNNATTPLAPEVLAATMPFLVDNFANASSTHLTGLLANEAIKNARMNLAKLIGSQENEIVFTSGATEAINLAIKGVAENYGHRGKHIITIQSEHSAVLDVCKYLAKKGFEISFLPIQTDGLVDLNQLKAALRTDTILVTAMLVNNEIGTIQPIKEMAAMTHEVGAFFMTDATQAIGKIPVDVDELGIDLMAMSAHKFYGMKGVGALFVRQRRQQAVKLTALLHGGGHEGGRRSGTLNVAGIVSMGEAAELCSQSMDAESIRIRAMRDDLEAGLLQIQGSSLNGNTDQRIYNTTNIQFKGCDSEAMIMGLQHIAVSNGSACTAASIEPSHVLLALGLTETEAFSCIRFSLGRFNKAEEIPVVVEAVKKLVESLRAWI